MVKQNWFLEKRILHHVSFGFDALLSSSYGFLLSHFREREISELRKMIKERDESLDVCQERVCIMYYVCSLIYDHSRVLMSPVSEQELRTYARKLVSLSPTSSFQQIPKIRQHSIFRSLGVKLLIYHFRKLIYPNTSFTQIAR